MEMGTWLGPYEILAPLGQGGMGEVYRATDTKLARTVALKVLSPALTGDADYMARFTREAHILASFNHPNIAMIYGLEDTGSVRALVMELEQLSKAQVLELNIPTGVPLLYELGDSGEVLSHRYL